MKAIMTMYALLTVALHVEAIGFPVALLPFIPENEITVVTP